MNKEITPITTELKEQIKLNVIDFKDSYSLELRNFHTNMIVRASSGDKKAKKYMKECIRQELIKIDKVYKNKELAEPVIDEIYAENWGLGILEKYDKDNMDELMIDGVRVSVEIEGVIHDIPEKFKTNKEAENIIRRVLEHDKGQDLSQNNPYKYSSRADGSRVTASIAPISKHPELNIRKFDSFIPTQENLIEGNTITEKMANITKLAINGYLNIAIIGEMGAGKTAFTRWVLGIMPEKERIGILENDFELNPEKLYPNLYFIQLRENKELGIGQEDLFKLLLRKNIKRILLGEVRSGLEAFQYLYACNRGHSGSIATSHNINAEGLINDYAFMIFSEGLSNNIEATKQRIASSIDLVYRFRKIDKGDHKDRVCVSMEEIVSSSSDYYINPIFKYDFDEENPSSGTHIQVGKISDTLKIKMNEYGIKKSTIERILG